MITIRKRQAVVPSGIRARFISSATHELGCAKSSSLGSARGIPLYKPASTTQPTSTSTCTPRAESFAGLGAAPTHPAAPAAPSPGEPSQTVPDRLPPALAGSWAVGTRGTDDGCIL